MGDKIDLDDYRDKIRESEEDEPTAQTLTGCPKCGDLLFMVTIVEDNTDVDAGGPYGLICQHCSGAVGSVFFFEEE